MTPLSTTESTVAEATSHSSRRCGALAFRVATCALLATIVIGTAGVGTGAENRDAETPTRDLDSAGAADVLANPTTIKLRRLHLVRPDLLPYPIQLEVYC